MRHLAPMVLTFLTLCTAAGAQQTPPPGPTPGPSSGSPARVLPLDVSHTGTDTVGKALAAKLRERVAASKNYRAAGPPDSTFFRINVVSVDGATPPAGKASAASIVYLLVKKEQGQTDQFFLSNFIVTLTPEQVDGAVSAIVNALDQFVRSKTGG